MGHYIGPDDISDHEQGNQGDGEVAEDQGYEGGQEEKGQDEVEVGADN